MKARIAKGKNCMATTSTRAHFSEILGCKFVSPRDWMLIVPVELSFWASLTPSARDTTSNLALLQKLFLQAHFMWVPRSSFVVTSHPLYSELH